MQIHAHNKKDQMQSTCFTPNPLWPASRESQHIQISWSVASSGLSWTQHIHNICTKANKPLGLPFFQFSTPASLFQMYISLVHPNLEYASQVWNPYKVREVNSLEQVQKFGLRMCAKSWDTSYQELLQLFSLPDLQ